MKVLALYLPQFHKVKENDEWWGEGFTEWTTVKSAEKLFDNHEQPRVPLNNNYYDLLDMDTMCWQADLMHKYNIDGMCFYHYYFKKGKKILEKPAENLLRWKQIDMPFCFSWANESWVRTWSRLSSGEGNIWTIKHDKNKDNISDDGVLLEQNYGNVSDWDEHYHYLVKFFRDDRYIKYMGMPVFIIYKPNNIPCLFDMLKRWDYLAQLDGFPGIYTIGTNVNDPKKYGLKGNYIQEPNDTTARFDSMLYSNKDNIMQSLDYQDVWNNLIYKEVPTGTSLGGFVGYDDTPRHGKQGCVIRYRNPYIFYEGMKKLINKANRIQAPFIFINAWNEWGEGMYLEPDEKYGTQFLEAFHQARKDSNRLRFSRDSLKEDDGDSLSVLRKENESLNYLIAKYRGFWKVLDTWMTSMENGESPVDILKKMGYKKIAIYGYGMLGKHLVFQMKEKGMRVDYVIERQKGKETNGIPLFVLDDDLPFVDVIIVSVLYDYANIKNCIKKKLNVEIMSIEELLDKSK
ncbi:Glycosyltransferase WbsX [Selenomonas sp. GACV-9]|uniref:glycosyltransferase WbsX family protein n=1 Tax=Selenomonas sp. GACV-9 TaxID=3158782 RepID=UPI0008F17D3E|nr:Glycosyltransferase WbsX [Selenomonas ruminantium]